MNGKQMFLLCWGLSVCAVVSAAAVEDHLYSGSKFVQEKKYSEAVREYETAVSLDPQNAEANLLLALTLANTGDLERAVQFSKAAVKLKPSYSGYHNLGLIYARTEKYAEAAQAYESALKINPTSFQAWHQLGKVYATDLKFDKAIEAYAKAVELNPRFSEAYQGLGSSYYWNGDIAQAQAQVERLKELNMVGRAQELDSWIQDKESKKKKTAPAA